MTSSRSPQHLPPAPPPRRPLPPPPPGRYRPVAPPPAPPSRRPSDGGGCITGGLLGLLAFLVVVLAGLGVTLLGYVAAAADLPSPDQLIEQSSQFQTTRIFARDGQILQEPLAPDDPTAGLRRRVALDEISPFLVQATIATEDANFYNHPGVDPVGLARAIFNAARTRGPVVGTSTISQQLVKLVFLSPERSLSRKVKEAILAAEITRRYDKDTILELYLNEIYYGHLAYGIEAAAQLYFNKPAKELTLAEAALLAGLPQSPATYDPLQNPEAAKARQADVLRLMVEAGFITPEEADVAWQEELRYYGQALEATRLTKAPHFVMYVRSQIEQKYGPELLYRGGLQVYTTLDPALQQVAETEVRKGVDRLADRQVSNGALVSMRPQTGEIVSMVGSADFFDQEIDGQVNVALAPRQPGSAIKPFTYLATFERERDYWTPATLVEDVRTEFDDGPGKPPYVPRNYDGQEHGWVSVRSALANSYNIPAVKALQLVGVDALLNMASRFGLDTLTRPDHPPYGLALTLGGGEVTLLELTGAYGALANAGVRVPSAAILCVLDAQGRALERLELPDLPPACQNAPLAPGAVAQPPQAQRAASAEHVYLITDILKDNEARTPVFGANSALRLDRPAAAKTGTSNDVRDGWTVGYTPELVTGVWMGNSDGSPMDQRLSGSGGAAIIWNAFMTAALANVPAHDFATPPGIQFIEICRLTGALPDSSCPPDQRRVEVFASGQLPPGADAGRYQVAVLEPREGAVIGLDGSVVRIVGSASVPDFAYYVVEYGETWEPGAYGVAAGPFDRPVEAGELAVWDLSALPSEGPHVIRVVAVDNSGRRFESPAVRVTVVRATATPEITETATPTETPTALPSPSATATPSPTPLPSATPSPTTTPTAPQPTSTPTLPGPTPTPSPPAALETPVAPPAALIAILAPPADGVMTGVAQVLGEAGGAGFVSYRLEFSPDQVFWQPVDPLQPDVTTPTVGVLGLWDTTVLPNGAYVLRLVVTGVDGTVTTNVMSVYVAN